MPIHLVKMKIGKLFLTSWTLIFLCISPWAYKQEGLIHEYKTAVFVIWAYIQGGLYMDNTVFSGNNRRTPKSFEIFLWHTVSLWMRRGYR